MRIAVATNEYDQTPFVDVTSPAVVDVEVREDGQVLWVNVNGRCIFRACQIGQMIVKDNRAGKTRMKKSSIQNLVTRL